MSQNFSPLIKEEDLQKRIAEMGAELTEKFKGQKPLAICVLKGSFMFYSDLIRNIDLDLSCEFLGASSYGHSTKSSGEIRMTLDVAHPIKDQDVIIIEDIVDTGLTMRYLQETLQARQPRSLTTVTLLHKPAATKVECQVDHVGFEIGNDFVVGYGLDYQGLHRNLPYIGIVQSLN